MNYLKKSLSSLAICLSFSASILGQNVGIQQTSPLSRLDVNGNLAVGSAFSGNTVAPADGAIIQGNLGVGTSAPANKLHVSSDVRIGLLTEDDGMTAGYGPRLYFSGGDDWPSWNSDNSDPLYIARYNSGSDQTELRINIGDNSQPQDKFVIGYVATGAGSWQPTLSLQNDGRMVMGNGAELTTGGAWVDASSRSLKENVVKLETDQAITVLGELQPVSFNYLREPKETYLGFIAENVPDLVAMNSRKSLNTMDIVAVLTKVVQDQQKRITELEKRLDAIR